MAQSTWDSLEVPILEAIERADAEGSPHGTDSLVRTLGMEGPRVHRALELLIDGGYVGGARLVVAERGPWYLELHLRPKGARAVGRWPSEDPYDRLVELIELKIAGSDDPEEKTKLRQLLGSVRDVGKGVATAILTDWAKHQAGM